MSVTIDGTPVAVGATVYHLTRGSATVKSVSDSHGGVAVAEFTNGSQLPFGHDGTIDGARMFGWGLPCVLWGAAACDAVRTLAKEFKV